MATIGIDPGTSNSAAAILRDKGCPKSEAAGRGDLYLQIAVQVPERLTKKEGELYSELRALETSEKESVT